MEKTSTWVVSPAGACLRRLAAPGLFAALVALGGHLRVPIPGNPVPFTLQVAAVLLAGAFLTPAAAAASMALFLATGAAGLPIFAGGGAGLAYLVGPTGGYLLGFVAAAPLCSFVMNGRRDSFVRTVVAMAAGVVTIHLSGIVHLGLYLGGDLAAAFRYGLWFVPWDVVKIAAAAAFVAGSSALSERGSRDRIS